MSGFTQAEFRPLISSRNAKAHATREDDVAQSAYRSLARLSTRFSFRLPGWVKQLWEVSRPFCFRYDYEEKGESKHDWIYIYAGETMDGASVPFGFRWFLPNSHPNYLAAFAVHDALYECGRPDIGPGKESEACAAGDDSVFRQPFPEAPPQAPAHFDEASDVRKTRSHADAAARQGLLVLGMHWCWAWAVWQAMRIGGGFFWYNRKKHPVRTRVTHVHESLWDKPLFVCTIAGLVLIGTACLMCALGGRFIAPSISCVEKLLAYALSAVIAFFIIMLLFGVVLFVIDCMRGEIGRLRREAQDIADRDIGETMEKVGKKLEELKGAPSANPDDITELEQALVKLEKAERTYWA